MNTKENAKPQNPAANKSEATQARLAKSKRRHSPWTDPAQITEELFQTMTNAVPVMIWVPGTDGRCTYFNNWWLLFTGRTLEQELTMTWTDRVHPDDRQRCLDTYLEAFHGRESFRMEHRLRRADGEYRWVLHSGVPWVTEEGSCGGYLGSCVDVTDLRRCKGALQAQYDDLEQRMQEGTASLLVSNVRLKHEIAEHKQAERQLIEQQAQLRALASKVLMAEERERRRIAIGLHDDIGQVLALLKLKAGELTESESYGKTGRLLETIRGLVDQAVRATRSVTFELSSPILYELGLEAAIQSLGEQQAQQHGADFHLETDHQVITLAEKMRVVIFRIVRELLCNIWKHARACNATVSMCRVGEHLQLTVEDDGVGFDAARIGHSFGPMGGFGLFSIREQITGIGGRFEVVSSAGAGTRVVVTAPLD
jgi:PAS domain S-box-containing protein